MLNAYSSGNKKIDNFIQEMRLKISDNLVLEWIPYSQFDSIEEISKGGFATVYSAIWKDGPLNYDESKHEYIRVQNAKVVLKCLYNSQNNTNGFLNEV